MPTKKVDKSADTGRFVTKKEVEKHPKTTYTQTVPTKNPKKGK